MDATIAERAGMSNASIMPVAVAIAIRIHSFIAPVAINAAVMNPDAAKSRRVSWSTRNRFSLSARTPPHSEKTSIGTCVAAVTSPSITSLSVNERINHKRP